MTVKRSVLFSVHRGLGARMTAFEGWEMPLYYQGIVMEHQAVRQHAAVFDVSHMGRLLVEGNQAKELLTMLTPVPVRNLAPGRVAYSFFCTPAGGIIDDLLIYTLNPDRFLLVVNAVNTESGYQWLEHRLPGVQVLDFTELTAMLAIQGPAAAALIKSFGSDAPLPSWFQWRMVHLAGKPCLLSGTGYTGERGYELFCAAELAVFFWERLVAAGACPAGLGARDSLRMEAALPLFGHELTTELPLLEAGLGRFIDWERDNFIGAQALHQQQQQGVKQRLTGLQLLEPGMLRPGYPVAFQGELVGRLTSGGYAPSLGKSIGLAYLQEHLIQPGQLLTVEIRGRQLAVEVVATPFYRAKNRNQE